MPSLREPCWCWVCWCSRRPSSLGEHRRLNLGLLLASVSVAVLVVWLAVAGVLSARAATRPRERRAANR